MQILKNSPEQIAHSFYQLLQTELHNGNEFLSAEMNEYFRGYYSNLFKANKLACFYEYNWTKRVINIIPHIINQPAPFSILDAGCGAGSESIFFSYLNPNLKITSIDGLKTHADLGRARMPYYEKVLHRHLNITFLKSDILGFTPAEPFDAVWVMEAISHIYPPEIFIAKVHNYLKKDGLIIISDTNLMNPLMYYRILRLRGFKKAEMIEVKDEETGNVFKSVDENTFSIFGIEKLLKKNNFEIISRRMHGFLPPIVFPYFKWSGQIETFLSCLPIINWFSGIYTIVAREKDGKS